MSLSSVVQTSSPGALVTLLRVDLTNVGEGVYYLTRGKDVVFGGQAYQPADIEFSGLETSGAGSLPTPRIKIATSNGFIRGIVNAYGDAILGCEVRRVRTFERFLDGMPDADPESYFGPDIFLIERRASENPIFVEYELSTSLDNEGAKLPRRQILRDACPKRYRRYDPVATGFDYSKATCPYAGTSYFTAQGEATTAENDRCGRKISDCWLRFGKQNPVPFGGFPGAARVRL